MADVTPSASVRQQMARRTTKKAPILCVEIFQPDEQDPTYSDSRWPIRLCDHTQSINHGGDTFTAVSMDWSPINREEEEVPQLIINVLGVGDLYSDLMRSLSVKPPRVDVFTVTIDTTTGLVQPTRDEQITDLRLKKVKGRFGISFTLRKREFTGPYPVRRYDGITFPGLR